MASQSAMEDFSNADKEKLITDAVFYVLSQEQKRPIFKKGDVMKAIGLTGRNAGIQDQIWNQARKELLVTFGYQMAETSDRKGFLMLNTILDDADEEERHLEFSDDEYAHQGLLLVVLSVIHMNNGCVKQEALFEFLKKMQLYDDDTSRRFSVPTSSHRNEVNFGDVKNLIEDKWGKKQHYIHFYKDDTCDADRPQNLYEWGERANCEIKKSDILKFVAYIYNKNVDEFSEEYKKIIDEDPNAFKEPEDNEEDEQESD
eukprot:08562.XXX_56138_59555_1 [CDS] Oithona nana genome sequencing.